MVDVYDVMFYTLYTKVLSLALLFSGK